MKAAPARCAAARPPLAQACAIAVTTTQKTARRAAVARLAAEAPLAAPETGTVTAWPPRASRPALLRPALQPAAEDPDCGWKARQTLLLPAWSAPRSGP